MKMYNITIMKVSSLKPIQGNYIMSLFCTNTVYIREAPKKKFLMAGPLRPNPPLPLELNDR